MSRPLTHKEQTFCEALVGPARGDQTKAASLSGYKRTTKRALSSEAHKIARRPAVAKYLRRLRKQAAMTADDLHRFWTSMICDEDKPDKTRLTAARDCAKLALGLGGPDVVGTVVQVAIGGDMARVARSIDSRSDDDDRS